MNTYERLGRERKSLVKFLKDKYTEYIALRELDLKFIQSGFRPQVNVGKVRLSNESRL